MPLSACTAIITLVHLYNMYDQPKTSNTYGSNVSTSTLTSAKEHAGPAWSCATTLRIPVALTCRERERGFIWRRLRFVAGSRKSEQNGAQFERRCEHSKKYQEAEGDDDLCH